MPFLIIHNRSTLGHQVIVQVRLANLTIELEVQWVSVLASDPLLSAASSQASQVTSSLGSAPQSALQRRELSHILQWTLLAVTCFAQFQIPNAFRHCGDLLAKGTSLNNARKLSSTIPSHSKWTLQHGDVFTSKGSKPSKFWAPANRSQCPPAVAFLAVNSSVALQGLSCLRR